MEGSMSRLDWRTDAAAIWRANSGTLRAVRHLDPVRLEDLLGVDPQKQKLITNTERFLAGKPANHVLLWGSRGTGKSSLVKALLNEYADKGLRLIEVDKDDLLVLPEIVDDIRERPQRFIIYCDDLSFAEGENQYKHLKSVLEGSIELPPENVRLYATSNRRHLIPEYRHENEQSRVVGTEIHHGDAVEEKISLADRFGLCLSFYPVDETQYFAMVDHLFGEVTDRKQLHVLARRFSIEKGVRSGRTAKQFYNQYAGEF
jgi:predicted AAA+ superfamily ATPase